MHKPSRRLIVLTAALLTSADALAGAQGISRDRVWEMVPEVPAALRVREAWVRPARYQGVRLDRQRLNMALRNAPRPQAPQAAPAQLELPLPEGTFASFSVEESQIMAPELAAKFPEIKTYRGFKTDDPSVQLRLDQTPAGMHAQILGPGLSVYIDPHTKGDDSFYSVYHRGECGAQPVPCLTEANVLAAARGDDGGTQSRVTGETLYTYRLAVATTGEYTAFHGGTVSSGLAAVVTAINRVDGIYVREFGVAFQLVANNDQVIFTNGATDPYSNSNGGAMLSQNQSTLNSIIGFSNYDVGHVFSTGGGGIASLRVTCTSSKARGVTGLPSPVGDAFYVDYVSHELGHQFGGNHTFNGINGSCAGGNRNGSTAYEPGSGSTIMAYAGICTSADNLQLNSDDYFHSESLREIGNWVAGTGGNCAVQTATGNNPPVVDAGPDFAIPMGTPFTLTGSASDADEDRLTFCWEQRDLGVGQTALNAVDNGSSPLFRSFDPVEVPWRTFPRWSDILNNTTTIGEVIPTTTRNLDFRVVVRDNRSDGGGVDWADMRVNVDGSRGPFEILEPRPGETVAGVTEIQWDVAGTDSGNIGATEVDIWLSTDSGLTFPISVIQNTPNDGEETVVLPAVDTNSARLLIEPTNNIFFDVTDGDFTIEFSGAPVAAEFPHEKTKDRYVSFVPANGQEVVAFDVTVTTGTPGSLGWVGEPYDASCFDDQGVSTGRPCTEDFVARIVDAPVFRVWPEFVVHLGDCGIIPDSVYEIRSTVNGADFSNALTVSTTPAPSPQFWGDCAGEFLFGIEWTAPNGIVNFNDIEAAIKGFQDELFAPHETRVDLEPEIPNYYVNFADISMVIKGFQGEFYPFSAPEDCQP